MQEILTVIKWNDTTGPGDLLYKLDALGVIFTFDFLIICKRSVACSVLAVIESSGVEAHCVLFTSEVLDFDIVWFESPVLTAFASSGIGVDVSVRFRTVRRRGKVNEFGSNGVSL